MTDHFTAGYLHSSIRILRTWRCESLGVHGHKVQEAPGLSLILGIEPIHPKQFSRLAQIDLAIQVPTDYHGPAQITLLR
jgi:hypothetical protein